MAPPRLFPDETPEERAARRRRQSNDANAKAYASGALRQRSRDYYLKHKYGLSTTDYAALFERAKSACEICDLPLLPARTGVTGNVACIDHDHVTGMVRGLLCRQCNSWLGRVNDNPQRAVEYLRKHR